ncbi:MAG: AMP-binding protein [Desulfococcaceae bacterium]
MKTFHTLQTLAETVADQGDKPFLVEMTKDGRRRYSYATLSRTARRLASERIQEEVQPGDVVGLFAPLGFRWVAACLAILEAGGVVMPLDLQLETETLRRVLEDSQPAAVFSDSDNEKRLGNVKPDATRIFPLEDVPETDADGTEAHSFADRRSLPEMAPEDPAAMFYTSGTTGPPKGVPLRHANLAFQLNTIWKSGLARSDDRIMLPLPPHHVYPFVIGILLPLALGLTLVLPHSRTGPQLVRALREGDATLLIGVPRLYDALYSGIADRIAPWAAARRVLDAVLRAVGWVRKTTGRSPGRLLFRPLHEQFAPRLRIMASGGAPLDPELGWKLEALGWPVVIGYGLTETAPLLTIKVPGDRRLETVGRAVEGVRLRIDPKALPESAREGAPPGTGEILAKGPNVFPGYHNLPEKTEETFTEDGWFRTGDLGVLDDDGYLRVTGRVSTLIVTPGGENIQPDQIEEQISASPLIQEAGVLQTEDGELAALVVPDSGEMGRQGIRDVDAAARKTLSEISRSLPSYQRIQESAVTRTALPRTRLGKIRRHLLAERYREARDAEVSGEGKRSGPISAEEMSAEDRSLLNDPNAEAVWTYLAERYPDQPLTPDAVPELDLGVDSMEWLNITLNIRRRTGVELEEETVAEIGTVRELLSAVAERGEGEAAQSLESPLEEPEAALSREQRRWLEPARPGERRAAKLLLGLDRCVMRGLFGLRVRGRDRLPESGPFIVAPNHVSYLDPFAVGAALGYPVLERVYWAGFSGIMLRNPFFRYFSRLARVVPIDPVKGVISSMAFGAAVLRRGYGLVWFPEGGRSPTGRLQPFKAGVGALLEHDPVPVVPALVRGTDHILPVGRFVPRRGDISVTFGEPVDIETLKRKGEGAEKRERIASGLREAVAALGAEGSRRF